MRFLVFEFGVYQACGDQVCVEGASPYLSCYGLATRRPILTYCTHCILRIVLGACYAMSGTDTAICAVLSDVRYAHTDFLGCAATAAACTVRY
eukprot:1950734-Rhodomonas_salina.1